MWKDEGLKMACAKNHVNSKSLEKYCALAARCFMFFCLMLETSYAQQTDVTPSVEQKQYESPKPLPGNKKANYPSMSRRLGEQGTVTLSIIVLKDGTVGTVNIHNSSGFDRLDKSAVDAVSTWKFEPAKENGVPLDAKY